MGSFKDLNVWQGAMALAECVYRETEQFPRREIWGLSAQMRGAAVSVPSNIAEGVGRATSGERRQFFGHARGSLNELRTQIELAVRLGYFEPMDGLRLEEQAERVSIGIAGLLR